MRRMSVGTRGLKMLALVAAGGVALALGPILETESWVSTHSGGVGGDATYAVAIDSAGNVASVETRAATPGSDGYVEKRAPDGTLVWSDVLDNPNSDAADSKSGDSWLAVCVDDDDNVIAGGSWSGNYYGGDWYHNTAIVRKYTPSGSVAWTWKGDGSYEAWAAVRALACDPAGNIYAAGSLFGDWGLKQTCWAIWKFSPDGTLQSGYPLTYDYGHDYRIPDIAYAIAAYDDGSFVVAGARGQSLGPDDARRDLDWHVRRYNSDRTLAWEATWAGSKQLFDYPRTVAIDGDGDVYVAGHTNVGTNNTTGVDWDALLVKYQGGNGYASWERQTGGAAGLHRTHSAAIMHPSGNVLVTANEQTIGQTTNTAVIELIDPWDHHVADSEVVGPGTDTALLAVAYRDRRVALGGQRNPGTDYDAFTALYGVPAPPNREPVFTEAPSADVSLAAVGETVHFQAAVEDPDDDPLTVTWDFGDGATSEGTSAEHVFAAPGRRTVVVTVSDGQASVQGEVDVHVGEPFVTPSVHANLNFARTGRDTLAFTCRVPLAADYVREGRTLTFNAGGVKRDFVLNRRGRASTPEGTVSMVWVRKKKLWQVSVNLAKGDYRGEWADEGLVDETLKQVPVSMKATLDLGGDLLCAHVVPGKYTARQGKFGHMR